MRTATIVAMAMLLPYAICDQYTGKITGNIIDVLNKQPLDDATISVLDSTSGIYVKHAVSNTRGEFSVTEFVFRRLSRFTS